MNHTIVVNEPTVNGQRHFGVLFEDGTRADYSVSSVDELKRRIASDSERLDRVAELLAIPVDSAIDTKPVEVPPTDAQVYAALEFKLVTARADFAKKQELGIVKADDPDYAAAIAGLEAAAKAAFKPEFIPTADAAVDAAVIASR